MPIDFHDQKVRFTYSSRQADHSWTEFMGNLLNWTEKQVVDIGCGGGIYTKAFVGLGAQKVIGIDFSEEITFNNTLKM
ncbi:class I SAM-dependent methyltransferase [Paenactinomyces guangxiensis]|uniref:class I SAM-dependent methyltransferase n=1 Tax=Paenactinomyces guangxiensis TaxID=1490290 RepID=UPI0035A94565